MSDLRQMTVDQFMQRCIGKGTDDTYNMDDVAELLHSYHALTAENERLREALKQVEWCQDARYPNGELLASLCPLCDQTKENGHAPDCLVGMALDAARDGRRG